MILARPHFGTQMVLPAQFKASKTPHYQQMLKSHGIHDVLVVGAMGVHLKTGAPVMENTCLLLDGKVVQDLVQLDKRQGRLNTHNLFADVEDLPQDLQADYQESLRALNDQTRLNLLLAEPRIRWDHLFGQPQLQKQHPRLYEAACVFSKQVRFSILA